MTLPTAATRVEIGTLGNPPTADQLRIADVPGTVVMNFAKSCNLWCNHCLYPTLASERASAGTHGMLNLPPATLETVADEMAAWGGRSVLRIAADGEPLINPHAVGLVGYAKAKGLTVSLTTNGILLNPAVCDRLLAAGIDVVDVSVDAASDESYGTVRPSKSGKSFYRIVERNVRDLIARRDATPGCRTRVMVNMIDQPLVHDEVGLFVRQWPELGADAVLIRPFHSTSAQTIQEGVATAAAADHGRFPCKFPFTRLNVGFDEAGHPVVYYCSHDWTEQTVVGVLGVDGGLRDIWHGAAMTEIRRRHLTGEFPAGSLCAGCPDWYLGWGRSHHTLVSDLRVDAAG